MKSVKEDGGKNAKGDGVTYNMKTKNQNREHFCVVFTFKSLFSK